MSTSIPSQEYQVVIIGGGGVGKSALTVQFIQGHFVDEYDPTIEDSYRKELTVAGQPVTLDVLDTAGQEEYSAMREQYVRSGQGFMLVYSVTARSSFEEVMSFYQQIVRTKEDDNFPVVLVGNKSDLTAERQVTFEEGQRLASKWHAPFLESSAKLRVNVDESFQTLATAVVRYNKEQEARRRGSTVSSPTGPPGSAGDRRTSVNQNSRTVGAPQRRVISSNAAGPTETSKKGTFSCCTIA